MTSSKAEFSAKRRLFAFAGCIAALILGSSDLFAAGTLDAALPVYQSGREVRGSISSMGDDAMQPLMVAWLTAFQKKQPGVRRGARWEHAGPATAFGALMFELADLAPLARNPSPAELAPY